MNDIDVVEQKLRTALRDAAQQVDSVPERRVADLTARPAHSFRTRALVLAGIAVLAVGGVLAVIVSNGDDPGPSIKPSQPIEVAPTELSRDDVDLEVFMTIDAPAAEIDAAHRAIAESRDVGRFAFYDKEAALREFKCIFSNDPDLVENITADALPTSFRIDVAAGSSIDRLRHDLEGTAGVDKVARAGVSSPSTTIPAGVDLWVVMKVDTSVADVDAMRDFLAGSPAVERATFVDREALLAEMQRVYAEESDLVANLPAAALPTSFQIEVAPGASVDDVRNTVEAQPGVGKVSVAGQPATSLRPDCAGSS